MKETSELRLSAVNSAIQLVREVADNTGRAGKATADNIVSEAKVIFAFLTEEPDTPEDTVKEDTSGVVDAEMPDLKTESQ